MMKNNTFMYIAAVALMVVCLLSLSSFTDIGMQRIYATGNQAPTLSQKVDQSMVLNGVDNAVRTTMPMYRNFTAELWAKSGTPTWNEDGFLMSARSKNGFILHPVKGMNRVDVYIVESGVQARPFLVAASFQPADITKWHHYAVVGSFVSNAFTCSLYLDGVLVATVRNPAETRSNVPQNASLSVGVDLGTRYGNVEIDEVRMWNTVRSSVEIAANKDRKLNGNESGLVSYWDFDTFSGGKVKDLASLGGSQDGTILGTFQGGARDHAALPEYYEDEAEKPILPNWEIADTDAITANDPYTLSLSVGKGKLKLSSTANLTLQSGSNDSTALAYTGSMIDLNAALATLTYQPNPNDHGTDTLSVNITDSGSASDTAPADTSYTFPITVYAINDAPSFSQGPDQTVKENSGRQTITDWATRISPGVNDETQGLTFQLTNSNPGLFLEQPQIDSSGTLTYQPSADVSGTVTVTVNLKDDGGNALLGVDTYTTTFIITILNLNLRPTINDNHSLRFNGIDNRIVVNEMPWTVEFTAEVWARSNTLLWNQDGFLLSSRGPNGFILSPVIGTNSVKVYIYGTSGTIMNIVQNTTNVFKPVDITQWHHYAVTYSLFEDKFTYKLFLDGVQIFKYTDYDPYYRSTTVNNAHLFIGQDDDTNPANGGRYGSADIDEVRIWNRALSNAEIAQYYNKNLTGNESGLTLYLDMSHINSNQIIDLTSGGHNGTFAGNPFSVAGPYFTGIQPKVTTDEDSLMTAILFGIVGDDDDGDTTFTVSLSAAHGKLHVPSVSGLTLTAGANDTSSLAYSGTAADLNSALKNTGYVPDSNYNGADAVIMTVTDSGNNGADVEKSTSQTYQVQVQQVNDAPSFTKGVDQSVVFNAPAQSVANWATDISAGAADEAIQGLTFLVNNDRSDLFIQEPAIDSSGALSFTPQVDVSGTATVSIALQDDGGTANGGSDISVSQTFTITIRDQLSPPSIGSVTSGDGLAVLSWSEVYGAVGYEVYQRSASTAYGAAVTTVSGSVYSYDVTGLSNGTTYYFVVKAVDLEGSRVASNEVSAIPQAPSPGAPVLQPAVAGNAQVSLTWSPVDGSTGYQIFNSVNSGTYGAAVTTVSSSVYSYDVTGLSNGTTYYLVVKAINPGGSSASSNEVSAMPKTFAAAPMGVTAVTGDGQAIISFTLPADNGGSALTGYEVTSSPGNIRVMGTASPITVTGLSNGTAYTFTVKAVNSAGSSMASAPSNAVTPRSSSSGGEDGGDGDAAGDGDSDGNGDGEYDGGSGNGASTPAIAPIVASTNGKLTIPAGGSGEVSLNQEATVFIPIDASDKELRITIEKMLNTQNLLADKDVLASPIFEILKNFPENFNKQVTLTFTFDPTKLSGNQKASVFYYDEVKKSWVEVGGNKIIENQISVEVNHFTKYAVFGVGQAARAPVNPTINFSDISEHWSEAGIKLAVSSGIVTGYPDGTFKPDHTVTRAEFAVMLMNSLKPNLDGETLIFTDSTKVGAWAQRAVAQAVQAGIIKGYADGSFRPDAVITRAEMAAMIAGAMGQPVDADAVTDFSDDKDIPAWAKGSVAYAKQIGIVQGKGANQFAPQDHATRAEAVTILLSMLTQKSK